jgi:hypothetical protein
VLYAKDPGGGGGHGFGFTAQYITNRNIMQCNDWEETYRA